MTLQVVAAAVVLLAGGLSNPAAVAAANPVGDTLTQSYNLRVSLNYSYTSATSRLSAAEAIAITNNGAAFDHITIDFLPRYLDFRSGYNYGISNVRVDGAAASWRWSTNTNMTIALGKTIATGGHFTLTLSFWEQVGLSNDVWGSRLGKANGILSLGNWFPVVSVPHTTRGFGEYGATWAAGYHVDITLADSRYGSLGSYAVVSTGKLTSRRTSSTGGTIGWVFDASNVRDFVISVMPSYAYCSYATGNSAGTIIQAQARTTGYCSTMISIAKSAFATYSANYDQYPYATYTVAQNGWSPGWMEYPSIILIGTSHINAEGIWHETAHQWFYGIMGNNQGSEAWLDEGWAYFTDRYFRGLAIKTTYGSTLDVNSSASRFTAWDGYNQYDDVVYRRAAVMINAMRAKMGSPAFFTAVRSYIADHRYKMVSGADLFAYLNKLAGGGFCGYVSYCGSAAPGTQLQPRLSVPRLIELPGVAGA